MCSITVRMIFISEPIMHDVTIFKEVYHDSVTTDANIGVLVKLLWVKVLVLRA
jgi:hypothetical protein